ncbi:MAG: hypothetical protein MN733_31325 [Nitrososphaera sp.]|nr:hypothetical protein [Nitrososphaera sp.]
MNLTKEQFLTLLQETQSCIKWYVNRHIRGRLRCGDRTLLCPITAVAWHLGYPLRIPLLANKSAVDLGLSEDLTKNIVDAADDFQSNESGIRQSLLKATGLA